MKLISKLKDGLKKIIKGDSLPCYIISKEPLIVVSYFLDFVNSLEKISKVIPVNKKSYAIFQLGYHVETEKRVNEIHEAYEKIKKYNLNMEFIFLANSPAEEKMLVEGGYNATFCHQNAFLDEN